MRKLFGLLLLFMMLMCMNAAHAQQQVNGKTQVSLANPVIGKLNSGSYPVDFSGTLELSSAEKSFEKWTIECTHQPLLMPYPKSFTVAVSALTNPPQPGAGPATGTGTTYLPKANGYKARIYMEYKDGDGNKQSKEVTITFNVP